jgi:hypothetical protein
MIANKTTRLNNTEETFFLELSFSEMHVLVKAIAKYSRSLNFADVSEFHAKLADQIHEDLTEIYAAPNVDHYVTPGYVGLCAKFEIENAQEMYNTGQLTLEEFQTKTDSAIKNQ